MKNKLNISKRILAAVLLVLAVFLSSCKKSETDFVGGYYYDQLDNDQKLFYEALFRLTPSDTKTVVTLSEPIPLSASESLLTEEDKKQAADEVKRIAQGATDAFVMDHPEYFWIDFSKSYTSANFDGKKTGSSYLWQVKTIDFSVGIRSEFVSGPSLFMAELDEALEKIQIPSGTTYEKLRFIHDYICENVYNCSTVQDKVTSRYTVYGSLVEGGAVCQGYAHAFKLLCDKAGIENILVSGSVGEESHMWNLVKADNGRWYAVDVTWDDGEKPGYSYFLVGANTPSPDRDNAPFCLDHISSGDVSGSGVKEFVLPTLASDSYPVSDEDFSK